MKPGDLVELKEGTFGLQKPDTYAIYLGRTKHKKQFFVEVFTAKGRKEVKSDNVRERAAAARLEGVERLSDDELRARLAELVRGVAAAPAGPPPPRAGEVADRDVWEAVRERPETTPGEAARAPGHRVVPAPAQPAHPRPRGRG